MAVGTADEILLTALAPPRAARWFVRGWCGLRARPPPSLDGKSDDGSQREDPGDDPW